MNKFRMVWLALAGVFLLALAGVWVAPAARAGRGNVIDDWVAAWNSHDPDAVVAVFTPDAVYEDVALGQVNHGRDEIRAFAEYFFTASPDLHIELVEGHLDDGRGTIQWVFSGTDVGIFGTGKRYSVRGVTVIDVHRGKITRNLDYYDFATILRELGQL
jgi:steroid delta-isomerase-like uncharacterized protein